MRRMKHNTLPMTLSAVGIGCFAVALAAASYIPLQAQAARPADRAAGAPAAPAPPRDRPKLVLSEEWKETKETGDITVTQQHVANPNLELKTYGPGAKGLMITGSASNPQNPTHVWDGLCEEKCAVTLKDKANYLDLTGQAKVRWVSKVSGFQRIHPIVKLADGTFLAGDWADGSTGDWRESEAYFAEMRWVKMDPARVATTGAFVEKPDLSKVDEFGWSAFMPASGHGQGGWADVGKIEVYGKAVPR
jgi:hypothetical protein